MSDTMASLLEGGPSSSKRKIEKVGDVYTERMPDGTTVYYPAKYFDDGEELPFMSMDLAQMASTMPLSQARDYSKQMKQAQSGAPSGQPVIPVTGDSRDQVMSGPTLLSDAPARKKKRWFDNQGANPWQQGSSTT